MIIVIDLEKNCERKMHFILLITAIMSSSDGTQKKDFMFGDLLEFHCLSTYYE